MGDVVDLGEARGPSQPRERTARDIRDQVDRAEFYRRIFYDALLEIRVLIATGTSPSEQIEVINELAKRAMEARW